MGKRRYRLHRRSYPDGDGPCNDVGLEAVPAAFSRRSSRKLEAVPDTPLFNLGSQLSAPRSHRVSGGGK